MTPSVCNSNVQPGSIVTVSVRQLESKAPEQRAGLTQLDRLRAIGQEWRRMTGVGVLAQPGVDVDDGDDGRQQIGAGVLAVLTREPVEGAAGAHAASQRGAQLSSST